MDTPIAPKPQKPRVHWSAKHGMWGCDALTPSELVAAAYNSVHQPPLLVFVLRLNVLNQRYSHA